MVPSDPTPGPDGERDVFGSLPNTRPQRRSARRTGAGGRTKAAAAPAKTAARPQSGTRAAAGPKAKPAPRAGARPGPAATPRAAAGAAGAIPPAGYATPRPGDDGVPRGFGLLTTAVQAAGELAHIALAAGARALKSALGRLPRP